MGKIAMLESELGGVNKTMKSLSNQGDENGKREEDLEEEIKDVKERFRNAEVNAAWLSGQYRNFRQKLTGWRLHCWLKRRRRPVWRRTWSTLFRASATSKKF